MRFANDGFGDPFGLVASGQSGVSPFGSDVVDILFDLDSTN